MTFTDPERIGIAVGVSLLTGILVFFFCSCAVYKWAVGYTRRGTNGSSGADDDYSDMGIMITRLYGAIFTGIIALIIIVGIGLGIGLGGQSIGIQILYICIPIAGGCIGISLMMYLSNFVFNKQKWYYECFGIC
jgi:hypothetical protein